MSYQDWPSKPFSLRYDFSLILYQVTLLTRFCKFQKMQILLINGTLSFEFSKRD